MLKRTTVNRDYPVCLIQFWGLIAVLILAVFINYIPHREYPLPLHLDEWSAIALSNELFENGHTAGLADPYTGGPMTFWQFTEVGFHLEISTVKHICNLSWPALFRYGPAVISMFVILAVYAAFKRRGFGWESAFFTALLPTSVGVLGPAFLVPVTMAVIFLPLAIFLAGEFDDFPSLVLLFIMVLVMLVTHAFTAIAVVVILSPYLFLNLKKKTKHAIALAAVLLLPFLLLLPWGLPYIHQVAGFLSGPQHLSPLVDYPRLIFNYGYFPAALLVLGSFCLFRRGRWLENGPVLGLAAWLLVMVVYYVGHLGLGGVYERGFLYAGLMMSFVSGVGLSWFIHFHIPGISHHPIFRFFSQNISKIIYILLVLCCLITVVPLRQHAGYYHMIANRDYCVFTWIEEHLGEDYDKAILDPWKATAFTAVTGRKVFSRTTMATSELDRQVYAYLDSGASNSTLLRENGITIVYSPVPVDNPDLIRIGPDIYLWSD